jgi:hypothetical protein
MMQVKDKVYFQVARQVHDQVHGRTYEQVHDQVYVQAYDQVRGQVRGPVIKNIPHMLENREDLDGQSG